MRKRFILSIIFTIFIIEARASMIKITRIIDGDTFETELGEKVRLVGINAPEIRDIYGEEAKEHLKGLVEGKIVDLLLDHKSNDRDKYNRLLRYVILNGVDINKQMIIDGFAFAYLKYHFDKESEYKNAQLNASLNNNGIWGSNNNKSKNINSSYEFYLNSINLEEYLIGGILVLLLFIGFYYYYKK